MTSLGQEEYVRMAGEISDYTTWDRFHYFKTQGPAI